MDKNEISSIINFQLIITNDKGKEFKPVISIPKDFIEKHHLLTFIEENNTIKLSPESKDYLLNNIIPLFIDVTIALTVEDIEYRDSCTAFYFDNISDINQIKI